MQLMKWNNGISLHMRWNGSSDQEKRIGIQQPDIGSRPFSSTVRLCILWRYWTS